MFIAFHGQRACIHFNNSRQIHTPLFPSISNKNIFLLPKLQLPSQGLATMDSIHDRLCCYFFFYDNLECQWSTALKYDGGQQISSFSLEIHSL